MGAAEEVVQDLKRAIDPDVDRAVEAAFSGLAPTLTLEEAAVMTARGKTQIRLPSEIVHVSRLWTALDRMMGPGTSRLMELSAAFPALGAVVDRMATLTDIVGQGWWRRLLVHRSRVEMDRLINEYNALKKSVAAEVEALEPAFRQSHRPSPVSSQEIVAAYKKALEDFGEVLQQRRAALTPSMKGEFLSVAEAQRKAMTVTLVGKSQAVGYAFHALAKLGDVVALGDALKARVTRALAELLGREYRVMGAHGLLSSLWPVLEHDSLLFSRALGVLENIRSKDADRWKLLRKAASSKINPLSEAAKNDATLSGKEKERVKGYLRQFLGYLPEEVSDASGVLEALGKKKAFEVMGELPSEIAKTADGMSLESLSGPFWIQGAKEHFWSEFGDGATILLDASGENAYLLLLCESKSYLPEKLFDQLFKRSDKRMTDIVMQYVDRSGQLRSVRLHPPPGKVMPSYVFSHPTGMTQGEEEAFKKALEAHAADNREIINFDLPFTRGDNMDFAWTVFREGVLYLDSL